MIRYVLSIMELHDHYVNPLVNDGVCNDLLQIAFDGSDLGDDVGVSGGSYKKGSAFPFFPFP